MTRHYHRMAIVSGLLSVLCNVVPMCYFIGRGMWLATPTQKVSIGFLALAALILGAVNLLMKIHPRSLFWLVLLGLYWVLGEILPVLTVMFITCFVDEIILTPMHKYSKSKYSINKEIDKRSNV